MYKRQGPLFRIALTIFTISFLALGYLGTQPATGLYTSLAQVFSVLYFSFFILMPIYTSIEKSRPVPERL